MNDLREILGAVWRLEPSQIPDDARINEFEPWDSLGHITLLLRLSEHFEFQLTPENVQSMTSLAAIEAYLASLGR